MPVTVRLLTHVLCKPSPFFFYSFIATMSYSLQTSFNSVMKDWADKYHEWGTPTRSPSWRKHENRLIARARREIDCTRVGTSSSYSFMFSFQVISRSVNITLAVCLFVLLNGCSGCCCCYFVRTFTIGTVTRYHHHKSFNLEPSLSNDKKKFTYCV